MLSRTVACAFGRYRLTNILLAQGTRAIGVNPEEQVTLETKKKLGLPEPTEQSVMSPKKTQRTKNRKHGSMQSLWYSCLQGKVRISSSTSNCPKQMMQIGVSSSNTIFIHSYGYHS
eukprot:TRINITY_DN12535_c1_g2_i9.p3 TRINITY_DN12535_c1_g2~~TRINITY_DN12535_c1_g2_i9.p3  ORF type:complete len:116 (-),score=5.78 TRINITY_DN12535_c1_g2_i9:938-1285(-)